MKFISRLEIEEFIYDNENEKLAHKAVMELEKYEDSGQVKKDLNYSMSNPDFHWYGKYTKFLEEK